MDVARENPVAGFEAPRRALGAPRAATLGQDLAHVPRPQDAERVGGQTLGAAGPELVWREEALLHEQALEAEQPMLVVGRVQVRGTGHLLARVARHVDVPLSQEAGGKRHAEHAAFPFVVEDRLVPLGNDGPHPVHASEIVRAVHGRAAFAGEGTLATPIIALRVTSAANCSSLIPSVPAGRSGSTR